MAGPKTQVALINAKIGATLNSTLNEYTVDCSTVNSLPGNLVIIREIFLRSNNIRLVLQDFSIKINCRTFVLKPNDYIVRVPSGNGNICVSGFQGVDVAPPGNYT